MKLRFTRLQAAHAFASMAENMSDDAREGGDAFLSDQYHLLSQKIWDDLNEEAGHPMPFWIEIDQTDIAAAVQENCEANTEGRNYHPDMAGDEADQCYAGECGIAA